MCFHAGATGHRPRATDGVDHDTQSHRFGQQGTNTGFEGRLEARTEMDELPWTQVLGFPQALTLTFFFVLRSLAGTNFVWSTVHRGFRSVRRVRDGAQPNKVCDSACAWELALLHF